MPPSSAAMELKVLISVLQSGQALQTLLNQTNQLTTALTKLQQQAGKIPPGGPPTPPVPPKKGIDDTTDALKNLDAMANKVISTLKFLAGGFLALQSVRFLKDLADTAARAEVLSTVLRVVGNNAGYSTEKLNQADRQIQALGITASASRQSLTQFIQAELDLADAPLLARAAQDAAVILGTNSSDAFERLVTAVQTTNTLMLRHMGIIVSADTAYQKYAQSIGKSVTQLTSAQRAQAFLNATLVQTQRIQGSYTAAMGDVGKQITSLERLTTDLKTSLGNNLLPAYLAVVEELTVFLQHLGLAADEMYGQGEGAKRLGEDVKALARNIRILAEFLVEHRKEILYVIVLWAGVSKIILPLINLFFKLKDAIAGVGAGGVLVRIVQGIGALSTGIITLGLSIILAEVMFDRFNAAIGSVVGAIWTLLEALDALIYAIIHGLIAAARSVYAFFAHPFTPSEWLKPWKEWADGVRAQIADIGRVWDLTKARFGQAFGTNAAQATPEQAAQQSRAQRFEEEAGLLVDIMEKTREYNALKKTGSAEDLVRTEKELKDLKEKASKLTEARKAEQDALKFSPGMKEAEEKRLQLNIAQREEDAIIKRLDKVREKSKYWYFEGEVSKPFMEQIGQFNDLLEIFNRAGNQAKVTTDELGRNLVESAQVAKTKADLAGLRKSLNELVNSPEFKKLPLADQRQLRERGRQAVAGAEINVRQERLRENAEVEKEREQHFRQLEKRRADHLEHEKNLMASAFELQEAMDEQSYTRRGMELDKYFDKRLARLIEQTDQELLIAKNNLAALEREREKKIPRTPQEIEELDTKITEAQNALAELQGESGTIATRIAKLGFEREGAREDKLKKSKQTLLDIAAIYGDEEAALAAVNNKYDEQYQKANTNEEREAIRAEQRREVFETELKYREKLLQLSLKTQQETGRRLEREQGQIDADKAHIAALEKAGQLSNYDAMRARNELLVRQIAHDQELIYTKSVELKKQENALIREEAAIRKDMAGQSEDMIQARLQADLAQRRQDIQGLVLDITKLNQSLEDSGVQIESYGKQIKEHFVDAFSDALTQSIVNFREAGKAWVSLGKSIANDIVETFVKAFTQRLFARTGIFNLIDRFMNRIFGGGGGGIVSPYGGLPGAIPNVGFLAEGGPVVGPGTGTSDSIHAMVSAGEHIMPADKAATWMPLLEGIRTGKILPFRTGGVVQSIALSPLIPRRYAHGGVVVSDGGASTVTTGGGGTGNMVVSLHPDALNLTMREWLEHEVVRQQGRR